jgi:ribonucleoside-diphosphate reductase alpha chain
LCGTLKADLPYKKVRKVREKNRRLGLGIMGLHEWLIKKGYKYEPRSELKRWLSVYENSANKAARNYSRKFSVSEPIATRAIAPTGSIGILAGTTTGIEPIFAVAYKRRYLKGKKWHYQYVVDSAAQELIDVYGVDPNDLESALHLAKDFERRIIMQAEVQAFVDQGISSTINLPPWNTEHNNPDIVSNFAQCLAKHSHRLRGFTCYPDGSRGGQPLVEVEYKDAVTQLGEVFEENIQTHDICEIGGKGGICNA